MPDGTERRRRPAGARALAALLAVALALGPLAGCGPLRPAAPLPGSSGASPGAGSGNPPATSVPATAASGPVAAPDPTLPRYDAGWDIVAPVRAAHGMVVSEQRLASEVGVAVLRDGGNAIDAAVAVGFALAVVLPYAGNLGGGGFMLLHDAGSGRQHAIDFREQAPARAHRDMFLDASGAVIPGRSLSSHLAVGVPGTVAGLAQAHARWGALPWARLVAPAVQLARDGFEVTPGLAALLEMDRRRLSRWPATRAVFFRGDRPLVAGERLVQADLARSLERIAQGGADAFYRGEIATAIEAEMRRHGGLIDRADLAAYRAVEREPVSADYRGHRVVSMPPPSSGGIHLLQMLGVLERWPLRDWGAQGAQSLHPMIEAMKHAYADRAQHLGDPDFHRVPQRWLLSRERLDAIAGSIDLQRARPAAQVRPGVAPPPESEQTTHYSIVDARGNAVAVTYTLNLLFGSGIVAEGTGILLNDEMDDFAILAGRPNAFGLTGGEANAIAPGKRPLSSMSPTIVLKGGQPYLVTGSPGGSRIITTVLQVLTNVIDHDMNPALAVHAPRVHHQWQPDELRVERGLSPDTLGRLRAMGHNVVVRPTMGRAQTIRVLPGVLEGASDPRSPDGAAVGH